MILSTARDNCGELLLEIFDNSQIYMYFKPKIDKQCLLSGMLSILVASILGISKNPDECCLIFSVLANRQNTGKYHCARTLIAA